MYHKVTAVKPACNVFYYEIDFVLITHFQSCKLQAKLTGEMMKHYVKQDLPNHANCSLKQILRIAESDKHMYYRSKHTPRPLHCHH